MALKCCMLLSYSFIWLIAFVISCVIPVIVFLICETFVFIPPISDNCSSAFNSLLFWVCTSVVVVVGGGGGGVVVGGVVVVVVMVVQRSVIMEDFVNILVVVAYCFC